MGTIDKRAERGALTEGGKRVEQARYRARYRGPDGREHSQTFALKEEAKRWLKEQETSVAQGSWVNPSHGRRTVESWVEEWLPTRRGDLRDSTFERVESICRRHILPTFGRRRLSSVTTREVAQWAADMQDAENAPTGRAVSSRTARKAVQVFEQVMAAAVAERMIGHNPVTAVKRPADEGEDRDWMTAEQAAAIEAHLPPEYRVVVDLGFRCGLRWGELTSLSRGDVDTVRSTIRVRTGSARKGDTVAVQKGKTKTTKGNRTVPVARSVMARIAQHLDERVDPSPSALVVPNRDGGPLSRQNFGRRVWAPARAAAGLPDTLTPHSMRHGYATALIAAGRNIKEVQTWCGHESESTTLRIYAHVLGAGEDVPDELDAVFAPVVGGAALRGRLPGGR